MISSPTIENKIISILSELVSYQTTSSDLLNENPERYKRETKKALRRIRSIAGKAKIPFIKEIDHNGRQSLLLGTSESKTPDILLSGHMDVVDGPSELFHLKQKGDKLLGRGAGDMKGTLVAMLYAFLDIYRQQKDSLSILFVINGDEEIGGENGAKYIAEELGYRAKTLVICPDGGENWKLIQAAKGALQMRFRKKGVSAHGSMPWDGNNAINSIMKMLTSLQDKYPIPQKEEWETPTLNIGTIHGGLSTNAVAAFAEATLDFRYATKEQKEQFLVHIKEVVPEDIEVTTLAEAALFQVDPNNHAIKLFTDLLTKAGTKVTYANEYGATDGRYWNQHDIPVLELMPPCGNLHADKEWVSLSGLITYYEVLKEFLQNGLLK